MTVNLNPYLPNYLYATETYANPFSRLEEGVGIFQSCDCDGHELQSDCHSVYCAEVDNSGDIVYRTGPSTHIWNRTGVSGSGLTYANKAPCILRVDLSNFSNNSLNVRCTDCTTINGTYYAHPVANEVYRGGWTVDFGQKDSFFHNGCGLKAFGGGMYLYLSSSGVIQYLNSSPPHRDFPIYLNAILYANNPYSGCNNLIVNQYQVLVGSGTQIGAEWTYRNFYNSNVRCTSWNNLSIPLIASTQGFPTTSYSHPARSNLHPWCNIGNVSITSVNDHDQINRIQSNYLSTSALGTSNLAWNQIYTSGEVITYPETLGVGLAYNPPTSLPGTSLRYNVRVIPSKYLATITGIKNLSSGCIECDSLNGTHIVKKEYFKSYDSTITQSKCKHNVFYSGGSPPVDMKSIGFLAIDADDTPDNYAFLPTYRQNGCREISIRGMDFELSGISPSVGGIDVKPFFRIYDNVKQIFNTEVGIDRSSMAMWEGSGISKNSVNGTSFNFNLNYTSGTIDYCDFSNSTVNIQPYNTYPVTTNSMGNAEAFFQQYGQCSGAMPSSFIYTANFSGIAGCTYGVNGSFLLRNIAPYMYQYSLSQTCVFPYDIVCPSEINLTIVPKRCQCVNISIDGWGACGSGRSLSLGSMFDYQDCTANTPYSQCTWTISRNGWTLTPL